MPRAILTEACQTMDCHHRVAGGPGDARPGRSQLGAVSNSAFTGTPSARAILMRFRNDGFRRATSMPPRYVRCIPASSASFS